MKALAGVSQHLIRTGKIPWRREWQPTPVFLPEESHGPRSLAGSSPRGHIESDTTEQLQTRPEKKSQNVCLVQFSANTHSFLTQKWVAALTVCCKLTCLRLRTVAAIRSLTSRLEFLKSVRGNLTTKELLPNKRVFFSRKGKEIYNSVPKSLKT